jgi:hypothetical protein
VTDYAKTTDFQAKDALPSGDANKVVKGTEFEAEFDNIVTAVASKADKASPTFTGVVVVPSPVTLGGTSMTATAAELNTLAGITATTAELNVLDGLDRGSILYGNASGVTTVLGQGTANQVLTSDGTDIAWQDVAATAAPAYNAWTVKTTTYTAVNGDQIIANHASTPFTVTLPASPSVGDSVILKNVGAALLTVGRNSQNINSAAANATMPTGNAAQLVYVDVTIGWKEL